MLKLIALLFLVTSGCAAFGPKYCRVVSAEGICVYSTTTPDEPIDPQGVAMGAAVAGGMLTMAANVGGGMSERAAYYQATSRSLECTTNRIGNTLYTECR